MESSNLKVKITYKTPEINLNRNGNLSIKGKSLPEDTHKFYSPVIDAVRKLDCKNMIVHFQFEYISTTSSVMILKMLEAIEANQKIESIHVKWYYEYDDIDILELGEIFESKLERTKFEFLEYVDVVD